MLSEAVNRHIELYRSMGFKYKVQAYMLRSFADCAQARSEEFVQTESVLEWAASAPSVRQRHDRLLTVRRLACALNAEDKRHQVPPSGFFGRARRAVGRVTFSRQTKSTVSCEPPPIYLQRDRCGQLRIRLCCLLLFAPVSEFQKP
jgi:hypothetical protein